MRSAHASPAGPVWSRAISFWQAGQPRLERLEFNFGLDQQQSLKLLQEGKLDHPYAQVMRFEFRRIVQYRGLHDQPDRR